jgi:demethylmenaquinone methyltransferase/2-methoxy-6-polyprenyl-1,4-benzoquinol methylase
MSKTDLLDYYAKRAPEYEEVYAKPERRADLKRVGRWLRDELSRQRVLEVACGTGYWTAWIAPVTEGIVATDAGVEGLDVARRKPYPPGRVRFVLADAYDLVAVPGEFSAAFVAFFWSHVPWKRTREFLRSLHDRVGPGARVVLLDNRYVPGSSTPIVRRDSEGNTYQVRQLADGSVCEVLKNFPTRAALTATLGADAIGLRIADFEYYWGASYQTSGPA